jgi:hypothetical protein
LFVRFIPIRLSAQLNPSHQKSAQKRGRTYFRFDSVTFIYQPNFFGFSSSLVYLDFDLIDSFVRLISKQKMKQFRLIFDAIEIALFGPTFCTELSLSFDQSRTWSDSRLVNNALLLNLSPLNVPRRISIEN